MSTTADNIQSSFLATEEEIILRQMQELEKDLEAIQRLRKKYSSTPSVNVGTPGNTFKVTIAQPVKVDQINNQQQGINSIKAKVALEYSSQLTWEQRIIFILNEMGSAYVDEVIDRIKHYEPEVSDKTIRNVATNKLSKMYRYKKIKADTAGRKYKYFL